MRPIADLRQWKKQALFSWIANRFVKRRGHAVPPQPASELTPHAVLFVTPANFDHGRIDVSVYRGLLYLQVLGGGAQNSGRLLTIWREKPAYEAVEAKFRGDTGLVKKEDAVFEGYHLETREARKSPWRRLTVSRVWAAVATLFLVLGYAEKIRDAYGWLIGPPVIEASVQSAPVDVMAGEPFKFEMSARNTRSLGDSFIEFLQESANPPNGLILDPLAVRAVPAVKPDGKAVLPVSGKALREGNYKVVIKGRAQAGFISRERTFELSAEVRVWAPLGLGPRRVANTTAAGKLCEAEFELRTGRRFPLGIEVEIKLERVPGVRFVGVRFPGTNMFTPYQQWDKTGKEVATLEWRTPELAPMRAVTFTVLLESVANGGKTANEWEVIVQSIQFAFNEAR